MRDGGDLSSFPSESNLLLRRSRLKPGGAVYLYCSLEAGGHECTGPLTPESEGTFFFTAVCVSGFVLSTSQALFHVTVSQQPAKGSCYSLRVEGNRDQILTFA